MVICNILWPFGIFYGRVVYVSPLWYVAPRNLATLVLKNWPMLAATGHWTWAPTQEAIHTSRLPWRQSCQMLYFQTKNCNWGKFWGSCNGKCWYILRTFGLCYGHLIYSMVIWYILWPFGIFSSFWYVTPRKIWQPCQALWSSGTFYVWGDGRKWVVRSNPAGLKSLFHIVGYLCRWRQRQGSQDFSW
jgi:hypothetical protein